MITLTEQETQYLIDQLGSIPAKYSFNALNLIVQKVVENSQKQEEKPNEKEN